LILLVTAPALAVLISFGDILITTLYDQRYTDAGWMLPLVALGVWPIILVATVDGALFALGNPRPSTWANFFSFLALFSGIWLGNQLFGIAGAVAAVPLSNVPFYGAIAYGLRREKLDCFDQDGYMTGLLLLTSALLIGGRYAIGLPLPLPPMH
jgi:O-antigen/teichoic acid export membrane protein